MQHCEFTHAGARTVAGQSLTGVVAVRGAMEYRGFIKKLDVPSGFTVPTTLTYDDIVARAISRADLTEDVKGINASIEIIQRTRGGGWPSEAITEEFN
jgi:hypothetical protein